MSTLSQFMGGGGIKPNGLINGSSTLNYTVKDTGTLYTCNARVVSFTPPAASALGTVLSLSGKGALTFAAVANASGLARTMRLKITLDGVVIFDATSASTASNTLLWCAIGGHVNYYVIESTPLLFDSSLLIEAASNTTGLTDVGYLYIPRA